MGVIIWTICIINFEKLFFGDIIFFGTLFLSYNFLATSNISF